MQSGHPTGNGVGLGYAKSRLHDFRGGITQLDLD